MSRGYFLYQKTIGALVIVIVFIGQWFGDEHLKPALDGVFSQTNDYISELKTQNYETLFYLSRNSTYLKDAILNETFRYKLELNSEAFASQPDSRFKPLFDAEQSNPANIDEYLRVKQTLQRAMGAQWKNVWVENAERIKDRYEIYKSVLFCMSVLGMLLIWNGERTSKK